MIIDLTEFTPRERLDVAIARAVPEMSRSRLQKLIEGGALKVGDLAYTDLAFKLREPMIFTLEMPPPVDATPQAENIPLNIVYEDADVIVVNKQAGLVVHPGAGNWTGTLVNALLYHSGATLSGIGGVIRPGIVHRLDKDTSGLMVVAKNDHAHTHLAAQFEDHGKTGFLQRAYLAFVWGLSPARQKIETFIDRDPHDREKMAVRRKGRVAITHIMRVDRFREVSLVECRLETGRTHQIRVHMGYIGHPLLADAVYGKGQFTKISKLGDEGKEALLALGRQALHASELGFIHPTTGEELLFKAELPKELADLAAALRLAPLQ
jgi:23S rRNA pseudouridine1911/1915/1917 synthase